MGACGHCKSSAPVISGAIGFCADCIRNHYSDVWPEIKRVHDESRRRHGLPEDPPRAQDGLTCPLCFHGCAIPEGGYGYCGLRHVENRRLKGGRPHEGDLTFYHDPLPTNCVADFVCPGGSETGYPEYSVAQGPEYGFKNLAVFYQACSFNCLYCQNFHYRESSRRGRVVSARRLADAVDDRTTCICYFGGDPGPQVLHAIRTSEIALTQAGGRVLRVCWETNGAMRRPFLKRVAELSLRSGGSVKFDLKAWDDRLHHALCGVSNRDTLRNFAWLGEWLSRRPQPPLLVASTLLVPGYVDEEEVAAIAAFIAGVNSHIPYRLLAFHPDFYLRDLPATSRSHAKQCRDAAVRAGLTCVSMGNLHLLGQDRYC
ncbi:MAG: radical SAM protein [Deltaproteobacteria bacterium]|nr:radical SAM protein [Deltaproteobacteria bacterium]